MWVIIDKKEFEYLYRRLETEINENQAKKDMFESAFKLLKGEIAGIDKRIDELTKEIIFVINELRKF